MKKIIIVFVMLIGLMASIFTSCTEKKPLGSGSFESGMQITSSDVAENTDVQTSSGETDENSSQQSKDEQNVSSDKSSSSKKPSGNGQTSKNPTTSNKTSSTLGVNSGNGGGGVSSENKGNEEIEGPEKLPTSDNTKLTPIPESEYYGWKELSQSGTEAEKKAYKLIVEKMKVFEPTIKFDFTITRNEFNKACKFYRADFPQHFWVAESYNEQFTAESDKLISVKFNFTTEDKNEIKNQKARFDSSANTILSKVCGSMSDFEKELIIHNEIVKLVDYDVNLSSNSHTAYSALVNKIAVCSGYSRAFQYLLREAGVQAIPVYGKMKNGNGYISHEWNMVKINNDYYHIDITADDPVISGGAIHVFDFSYFNVTESLIKSDHVIEPNRNVLTLPDAKSDRENFYKHYGFEFSTLDVTLFARSLAFSAVNDYDYAYFKVNGIGEKETIDFVTKNYKTIFELANKMLSDKKIVLDGSIEYITNSEYQTYDLKIKCQ